MHEDGAAAGESTLDKVEEASQEAELLGDCRLLHTRRVAREWPLDDVPAEVCEGGLALAIVVEVAVQLTMWVKPLESSEAAGPSAAARPPTKIAAPEVGCVQTAFMLSTWPMRVIRWYPARM